MLKKIKKFLLGFLAGGPLDELKTYTGLVLAFLPAILPEIPIDMVKPLLDQMVALYGPTVELLGAFMVVWGGLHKVIKAVREKRGL